MSTDEILQGEKKKKKKKKGCCVFQVEFLNIWVYRLELKKKKKKLCTQNYKIWVHFPPFFLKTCQKTPNLTKIGCITDPNYFKNKIVFLEIGWSLRATQHFFLLALFTVTNQLRLILTYTQNVKVDT